MIGLTRRSFYTKILGTYVLFWFKNGNHDRIGVALSAVPVFLYQGIITLFSTQISRFVPDELLSFFISEMTATGGLMILAIGLNLIGLTKIRVANLIPGILVVAVVVTVVHLL